LRQVLPSLGLAFPSFIPGRPDRSSSSIFQGVGSSERTRFILPSLVSGSDVERLPHPPSLAFLGSQIARGTNDARPFFLLENDDQRAGKRRRSSFQVNQNRQLLPLILSQINQEEKRR
jgi:hypothetical protein